jgi:signal transduction histidine kinase
MRSRFVPGARESEDARVAGAATRWRLMLALSGVLASLVLALGVHTRTLQRMGRIVDSMEQRDEVLQLALQLRSAIGDLHAHQGDLLVGSGAGLGDYEEARRRAWTLLQRLDAQTRDPRSAAALAAVREATSELHRLVIDRVSAGTRVESSRASLSGDRTDPLVTTLQKNIDRNLTYLQASIDSSRGELQSLEKASTRWLATVLVVAATLFVAALVFLSRSIARPVTLLAEGATILGRGDLDHRIPVASRDDFGIVAEKLNSLAASMREQRSRLVQTERLATIGRIAAGIAQEMRGPLHSILGSIAVERRQLEPDSAARFDAVEEEALRCLQVVEGMLLLSRQAPIVELRAVDLRQVCDDVADCLRSLAAPAKVEIAVSGAGCALADRWKLRQALFHLVRNAVEAAGWEGKVQVQIGEAEDGPQVRVSDTGPGIAPGLDVHLFEPLFTTKESGAGLGLAVSRAIVRAHGGDIDVWNGDQGGAVFLLHLPRVSGRAEVA